MTIVNMQKIQVSKFKAQCLRLLDEVNRTGESLIITRNGLPLAVINPVTSAKTRVGFGIAKGTAKIKGDLVTPALDIEEWEILN